MFFIMGITQDRKDFDINQLITHNYFAKDYEKYAVNENKFLLENNF